MKKNNFFNAFIMFVSVVIIVATVIILKDIWYGPKIEELDSKELEKITEVFEKATAELPRKENEKITVKTIIVEYKDPSNNNRENVEVKIENGQVSQKRIKNENYKPDTVVAILETYLRVVIIIVIGGILLLLLFLLVRYKTPKIIRKWEIKEKEKEKRDELI